jgi:hypothetical protein
MCIKLIKKTKIASLIHYYFLERPESEEAGVGEDYGLKEASPQSKKRQEWILL